MEKTTLSNVKIHYTDIKGLICNEDSLKIYYEKNICTYHLSKNNYFIQDWYFCEDCYKDNPEFGCCLTCANICHQGHKLEKKNGQFYCDCPNLKCNLQNKLVKTIKKGDCVIIECLDGCDHLIINTDKDELKFLLFECNNLLDKKLLDDFNQDQIYEDIKVGIVNTAQGTIKLDYKYIGIKFLEDVSTQGSFLFNLSTDKLIQLVFEQKEIFLELEKDPNFKNDPISLYLVGIHYLKTTSFNQEDTGKEIQYLKLSSKLGNENALKVLFFHLAKINSENAYEFLREIEKSVQNETLYYLLGISLVNGIGVDPDFKEAKNYFELSEKNVDSLCYLGLLYFYGLGFKRDIKKSIEYFVKSVTVEDSLLYLLKIYGEKKHGMVDDEKYKYYTRMYLEYFPNSEEKIITLFLVILIKNLFYEKCHDLSKGYKKLNIQDYNFTKKDKIFSSENTMVYKIKQGDQNLAIKRICNNIDIENYIQILNEVDVLNLYFEKKDLNIVKYHGYFQDNEYFYLVFDYIESDLSKLILNHQLNEKEKVEILNKILKTMIKLHDVEIIHRDLKPSNILVDKDLNIYITDFGMSRMKDFKVTKSHEVTKTKNGTHFFKPCELVCKGLFGEFTDVFSFGVLMFELFNEKSIISQFGSMNIDLFYLSNDGADQYKKLKIENQSLNNIMHRCLNKDYSNRPNFKEIHISLQKYKEEIQIK